VNQYIATYNANVAAYRQSVLTHSSRWKTSLAAVRILSQQIRRQQEAVDSSQTFLKLELGRYETASILTSTWSQRKPPCSPTSSL
jgi:outer membrane protein TolC